jgi:hypothetical protein
MSTPMGSERDRIWPDLPYEEWKDTYHALHLWSQVVGKVKLALEAPRNHFWQVSLLVSPRGLTTGFIPHGKNAFEMEFDFPGKVLRIDTSRGHRRRVALEAQSVASFHRRVMAALAELGLAVKIRTLPQEIPEAVPFEEDTAPRPYDAAAAERFWRILLQVNRLLLLVRGEFTGKAGPPQFFWGSFDLCHARFSGRPAPRHPPSPLLADTVLQEAYAEEEYTVGFWPGTPPAADPHFFAYIYPEPPGFPTARVEPRAARYSPELGEFLLPYREVRLADDPDAAFLEFARTTYRAAADLAGWDRSSLERKVAAPAAAPAPLG